MSFVTGAGWWQDDVQRSDYPGGSHGLCGAGRFGRTFRDLTLATLRTVFSGRDQASRKTKIDPVKANLGKLEKEEVTVEEKLETVTDYARNTSISGSAHFWAARSPRCRLS